MTRVKTLAEVATKPGLGAEMHALAAEIFPICRSITGDGVRETLDRLGRFAAIEQREVPTGTKVLDWEVPKEWSVHDAYIKDAHGERVVDFKSSNLHVLGYSVPICRKMTIAELKRNVFTLPEQPDLIPYRTSYYSEQWGFCLSHRQLAALEAAGGEYEVCIDATLKVGAVTWGEYLHQGETKDEVLLSTHVCHPSLANDNCSGVALLAVLARELRKVRTRLSYRFLFIPGTIGSIAWLANNEAHLGRIKHGLVVSCVGDSGGPTYKRSRRGNSSIDRAMVYVLRQAATGFKPLEFFPYGYDERQFCSPGFDLPVGLFQRSQFSTFPEYHNSADNLEFIKSEHLATSLGWIGRALSILEADRKLMNLFPKGEPQLGRRGLYAAVGGEKDAWQANMAMLWVLNQSDGQNSLFDIAERSGIDFETVVRAAETLERHGLVASLN